MKYLVQIGYKSGNSVTLWFKSFKIHSGIYEWELADPKQKVLKLNPDEIEFVVQLDAVKE